MSSGSRTTEDLSIAERIERLETIVETLEEQEVSLERAKELRQEADDHLEALRGDLDIADGEIIEVDFSGAASKNEDGK